MKQTIAWIALLLFVALCLLLGYLWHGPSQPDAWVREREGKALEACVTQNGVPFLTTDGDLTECRWQLK
jgi:preprotein translocase subunit SecG